MLNNLKVTELPIRRGLTKAGFNDEQALEIVIRMLLQNLK